MEEIERLYKNNKKLDRKLRLYRAWNYFWILTASIMIAYSVSEIIRVRHSLGFLILNFFSFVMWILNLVMSVNNLKSCLVLLIDNQQKRTEIDQLKKTHQFITDLRDTLTQKQQNNHETKEILPPVDPGGDR